ncbi:MULTISPECIES: ATP-binding protein [Streptomyces]|uniref:histidine kinase n=1 Tax=Streptomyces xinghaiensis TaxID=1038928 RepID=A0A3M8F812_9ACTN|nr:MULTISPECIES: ATP-binding protein [Streptomyces]OFA55686.1 hypothetical protein BEN35_07025 [Streptomyces fradiae]PQM23966.1 ATP-binding protein [Streptomyces xinghaiensis]RKM91925.1 ATP-binding protein [Streptomyces xinghaiensis]RNC73658.1 ATP-binding protein [Streptomyces xinghaiensis]
MLDVRQSLAALILGASLLLLLGMMLFLYRSRQAARRGLTAARRDAERATRFAENAAAHARRLEEETRHLAEVRLPAAVDLLARSRTMSRQHGLLHPELEGTGAAVHHEAVVGLLGEAVRLTHARVSASAKATVSAAASLMQGLANQQYEQTHALAQRFGDDTDVLEQVLRVQHANAQLLRRCQGLAMLGGTWPGQLNEDTLLYDVVRGAMSRIEGHERVQVQFDQGRRMLRGQYVEPLVAALAELLANALALSHPGTQVRVNFENVHNGIVITIDDAGIGLNPHQRGEYNAILSGRTPVDLSTMGNPPRFGLPLVGVICARYGFQATLDRSPYQGVRAVLGIPTNHLAPPAHPGRPGPEPAPLPPHQEAPAPASPSAHVPEAASAPGAADEGGLPQRRRLRQITSLNEIPNVAPPPLDPQTAASRIAQWWSGTSEGRTPTPEEGHHP